MAYADQQMSGNRVVAIIIVGLIHIALGYALITGLAYEALTLRSADHREAITAMQEKRKPVFGQNLNQKSQ